ncbi:hypothetical protein NE237_010624 [Protea cynaroides]|uniref:Uncharacterized protein n=1 Tax=Protea cynaroides TaxID=273540 RepID=A0A9Q0R1R3_9MAGN|nr:hypothetical protein NE237_010624 [Protea cynaroides]
MLMSSTGFKTGDQGFATGNVKCKPGLLVIHEFRLERATSGAIQYDSNSSGAATCFVGSSSSCGRDDGVDNLFSLSHQIIIPEIEQNPTVATILCPSDASNLQYQAEFITVFINGVPTEVPKGPLDLKGMLSQDVLLVHSSGLPVPFKEFGISLQSLQLGESYFLGKIQ